MILHSDQPGVEVDVSTAVAVIADNGLDRRVEIPTDRLDEFARAIDGRGEPFAALQVRERPGSIVNRSTETTALYTRKPGVPFRGDSKPRPADVLVASGLAGSEGPSVALVGRWSHRRREATDLRMSWER